MTKIHGDPFHHVDYNAMVEGINQNGVLSGLAVSQHAAGADMSVDVAAGSALIDEEKYIETGVTNIIIDASESGKHRKDTIIYDTATSAPVVIKGTSVVITSAAAPPSVTADDILLAVVYIGDSVPSITDTYIYDGRIIVNTIKDNWTATTDPDNNDDTDSGYGIGSRWVNTSNNTYFVCVNATAGAAVWWNKNLTTTTSPAASNDNTEGYTVGSRWINTITDQEFVCLDATTNAAIWIETTSQLQDDFLEIIRQMHPNVSVLAAMDTTTLNNIFKSSDVYKLITIYDNHNDNSVDGAKWTIDADGTSSGGGTHSESVTEVSSAVLQCYADAKTTDNNQTASSHAYVTSATLYSEWQARIKGSFQNAGGSLYVIGASDHRYDLPNDAAYHNYTVYKDGGDIKIAKDMVVVLTEAEADATFSIQYRASASVEEGSITDHYAYVYVDFTGSPGNSYGMGLLTGDIISDALPANAAVLSFFSHLKGKFSNGDSTAIDPVEVEMYGNGDSYASALNGATKLKIDPADPIIELYRIDDSEVAKSDTQTDWVLDDNATNGAFRAKTTSTHETILAEEIGCASVVMVEKSVDGGFTDTLLLVEDDDYTVDYSTRTATKIILTTSAAADIVNAQSKLRITWIVDVENIGGTANTALKMKIYLNRTAATEASPEIQPIDLGTGKYAEMKYMCG